MKLRSKKLRITGYVFVSIVILVLIAVASFRANRASVSAEGAAERFYRGWLEANTNPGDAFKSRLHQKSTYVTESLTRAVDKKIKYAEDGKTLTFDPVLCGTEVRGELGFNMMSEGSTTARTILTGVADGPINIYLVKEDTGWWHVDEIDCPAGSQPKEKLDGVLQIKSKDNASSTVGLP